jgi:hypothetical protein
VAKFVPPGFDADAARQGILNAMSFGEPTRTDDKAWFYFSKTRTSTPPGAAADQDGVPFDSTAPVLSPDRKPRLQVPCAIDYVDVAETTETFGSDKAARIVITLLDTEYQRVKGFAYVVAGGDKYVSPTVEPPVALGTIDVWTVHCVAEDES